MSVETLRAERLADLKAKLAVREGKSGFGANVEAIKAQIADLEAEATYRRAETGEFVEVAFAIQNPETVEVVEPDDG